MPQLMQLGLFVAAMAAIVVCGCIHAETKKKATKGNLAADAVGRTSARLFRSRRRKGR